MRTVRIGKPQGVDVSAFTKFRYIVFPLSSPSRYLSVIYILQISVKNRGVKRDDGKRGKRKKRKISSGYEKILEV